MKNRIILLLILFFLPTNIFAETYTIDVSRVLNNSLAGKEAQKILKKQTKYRN